jgi:hypothetical protein
METIFSDNRRGDVLDHLRAESQRRRERGETLAAAGAKVGREDAALEPHFSIKEIAKIWGLCENSVRDLFKDEPGVIRIQRPKSRFKRSYTTLRIPRSVLDRVHRRMAAIPWG